MIRDRWDLYVDVDAVQERAGDSAEVVSYLKRSAAALFLGMTIKSTGTAMRHRLQTLLNHGKPNVFTFELEINLLEEAGFYKTNPKTLGEYIRKTRLDRKMTAKKLAKLMQCSKNILLDWEKDRRIPRLTPLKSLYYVLNVPHKFLRKAIVKSYSLSGKEKDMLFKFDLIQVNLNESMKPLSNQGWKNFLQVGSLLKILRLSLFIPHREFAKIVGIDPSAALDWENGRHRPTKSALKIIMKIFNFTKLALRN